MPSPMKAQYSQKSSMDVTAVQQAGPCLSNALMMLPLLGAQRCIRHDSRGWRIVRQPYCYMYTANLRPVRPFYHRMLDCRPEQSCRDPGRGGGQPIRLDLSQPEVPLLGFTVSGNFHTGSYIAIYIYDMVLTRRNATKRASFNNVRFEHTSITQLPLPNASVDCMNNCVAQTHRNRCQRHILCSQTRGARGASTRRHLRHHGARSRSGGT